MAEGVRREEMAERLHRPDDARGQTVAARGDAGDEALVLVGLLLDDADVADLATVVGSLRRRGAGAGTAAGDSSSARRPGRPLRGSTCPRCGRSRRRATPSRRTRSRPGEPTRAAGRTPRRTR